MMRAVSRARNQAEQAKQNFYSGSSALQYRSNQSIDLFGGQAPSQISGIVVESRRLSDTLYATYQALIIALDEECRPLLAQNPDLQAVREVTKLIEWLNSESEITNNYSASVNYHSLGQVASQSYLPSMQCQMIQSYWEAKYSQWPGRAQEEAMERELAAQAEWQWQAEQTRQKQQKEHAQAKLLADYQAKLAAWQEQVAEAERKRERVIADAMVVEAKKLEKDAHDAYLTTKVTLTEQLSEAEMKKAEAETTLSSLTAPQFLKKHSCKMAIEELSRQIRTLQDRIQLNETSYATQKADIPRLIERKRATMRQELSTGYVLPPKPRKPYIPSPGISSFTEDASREILKLLEQEGELTLMQMSKKLEFVYYELSIPARTKSILRLLIPEYVEQIRRGDATYYKLAN